MQVLGTTAEDQRADLIPVEEVSLNFVMNCTTTFLFIVGFLTVKVYFKVSIKSGAVCNSRVRGRAVPSFFIFYGQLCPSRA